MEFKLGEKLRKVRKAKGMSIAALAEKAGVSPGMISQIERNTTVTGGTVKLCAFWAFKQLLNKCMFSAA